MVHWPMILYNWLFLIVVKVYDSVSQMNIINITLFIVYKVKVMLTYNIKQGNLDFTFLFHQLGKIIKIRIGLVKEEYLVIILG